MMADMYIIMHNAFCHNLHSFATYALMYGNVYIESSETLINFF